MDIDFIIIKFKAAVLVIFKKKKYLNLKEEIEIYFIQEIKDQVQFIKPHVSYLKLVLI
jgi:hypothetical protein